MWAADAFFRPSLVNPRRWVRAGLMRAAGGASLGHPQATGPVMLELVDMEEPPLRIFFGKGPLDLIRADYANRLSLLTTARPQPAAVSDACPRRERAAPGPVRPLASIHRARRRAGCSRLDR